MPEPYSHIETEEAIERGFGNASDSWKESALKAIHEICINQKSFTADDVRHLVNEKTHDPRAMGGVIRTAKKNGWCKPSGFYEASKFTHGHIHQVWLSLVNEND